MALIHGMRPIYRNFIHIMPEMKASHEIFTKNSPNDLAKSIGFVIMRN